MIKNLFKFISFKNKTTSDNSISFIANAHKDIEPSIKISIGDTSDDACKKFTEILFNLNSGQYYKSIIDLLNDVGQKDNKIYKFVETSILYWSYLLNTKYIEYKKNNIISKTNKPLIMPTDFNKNAK